ncbi:hypothetical protein CYMTET_48305 [Cymbomonas tetramitiformis]|uniref:Calpain catalytic domain-containing protein n=1 Tax=Cymbomonas tetramitiformis TaxID=36881 RepID=A0AAE0BSH7_9CHLO|nr:hypothetical protein CYMTET_48305 [Cymbomonas tetramitiformis]
MRRGIELRSSRLTCAELQRTHFSRHRAQPDAHVALTRKVRGRLLTIPGSSRPTDMSSRAFKYEQGCLGGGNDYKSESMSLEEAMEAASCDECIGFTWNGEREPEGAVHVFVKNTACSTKVKKSEGWHTLLRVPDKAPEPTDAHKEEWAVASEKQRRRHFEYHPGFLRGLQDVEGEKLPLQEAMRRCASVDGTLGLCWEGDKDPGAEGATVFIVSSEGSREVSAVDGWNTLLLQPEGQFEYAAGSLPGGNDLITGPMSLEEAVEAADCPQACGFTWSGEREPEGQVPMFVKTTECGAPNNAAQGWHTMLRVTDTSPDAEVRTLPVTPRTYVVPSEALGTWPEEALATLVRAGDVGAGFDEDPLPAVLAALPAGTRFIDAEFPPCWSSIGEGRSTSAIHGSAKQRSFKGMTWVPAASLHLGEDGKIASTSSIGKVEVRVENVTGEALDLFWVSFSGEERLLSTLAPDAPPFVQVTYATHVFRCKLQSSGAEMGLYVCTEESAQTWTPQGGAREGRVVDVGKMELFEKSTCQATDVMQGGISDCWLMQSIAAAAYRFPDVVVESINPKVPSEQGVYSVRMWSPRHQHHFYLLLDDYIPTMGGLTPYFSRFNAQGAGLWVMLIEKAFAKLGGGYSSLNNKLTKEGSSSALCRLLGGTPGVNLWDESQWEELIASEALWEEIVERRKAGGVSVLASAKGTESDPELVGQDGLVTHHGYTLLALVEVQGLKMMQIRNVWGHTEWRGDWSDESPLWDENPDVRAECGFTEVKDDGIFWMCYPDFVREFGGIWHN